MREAVARVSVQDAEETRVLDAVVPASLNTYRAPPWLIEKATHGLLQWRVDALDFGGKLIGQTPWRALQFTSASNTP